MNHNAECKKHKKETCNTFETMVRKRKVENKQCEEGKKTNLQPNKKHILQIMEKIMYIYAEVDKLIDKKNL